MLTHQETKVFKCRMKSREEMEKSFSQDQLGWWHDCLAGQIVSLREATASDMNGKWMRRNASKNHKDYMVENIENGKLVPRKAVKHFDLPMTLSDIAESIKPERKAI